MEWEAVRFEVDKIFKKDHFECPACSPDMLAVSVDGNRKHYRFKSAARYLQNAVCALMVHHIESNYFELKIRIFKVNVYLLLRSEEQAVFDGVFIANDDDVERFVNYIHSSTSHVNLQNSPSSMF